MIGVIGGSLRADSAAPKMALFQRCRSIGREMPGQRNALGAMLHFGANVMYLGQAVSK
jgi:hypothetical protein